MNASGLQRLAALIVFIFACALTTPGATAADEDLVTHRACRYCGMDRAKFAHARVLVTYDDGTIVGACSLHCAAIDLSLEIDKTPVAIMVADYNTKRLIDAETAHWVIGGEQMGVMTRRAKWAFASEADAHAFVNAGGGRTAAFETAFRAAFEDMYADLQMIRQKRQKMRAMKTQ